MSSMASGGGAVVSAVANADGVLALIRLLTDTAKFGDRLQILQQAEQQAQAALTESKALAEAAAVKHAGAEAAAESVREAAAAHAKAVTVFNESSAATSKHLNDWQADLESKDAALQKRVLDQVSATALAQDNLENRDKESTRREARLAEREAEVAKREKTVNAKLAKIREIEQVG